MTALAIHRDWSSALPPAAWVALGTAALVLLVVLGALAHHRQRAAERFRLAHVRMGGDGATPEGPPGALPERMRQRPRALTERQRRHVQEQWLRVRAGFVENPWSALRMANALVKGIVTELGYGGGTIEQRLSELARDHADATRHYREARALVEPSDRSEDAPATTEDLRRAMLHYAAIVEELA